MCCGKKSTHSCRISGRRKRLSSRPEPDAAATVVPAQAGTHTPRPLLSEKIDNDLRANQFPPVVMGPGLRRDDGGGLGRLRFPKAVRVLCFTQPGMTAPSFFT